MITEGDGNQEVLTRNEMENLNDVDLKKRLKDTVVFARVFPKHKLRSFYVVFL
ncbi:MAG: hypothetical protein KBA53_05660 [Thermoclostridium sp.]|nr:hypothetical protein [Thermoclostridium sp.]